jgi:hypothetical protein
MAAAFGQNTRARPTCQDFATTLTSRGFSTGRPDTCPPDFVGLSGTPELQALVRRHHEAAGVWSEARKHEFVALTVARQRVSLEWEVVQTIERGSGRKARPFELDIRVLPVAAVQAWRLSPKRALVSRALFRDRAAYREWLRPIIEELA